MKSWKGRWYCNSSNQMLDPEMEWLQSQNPAACAVWEWLKGDASNNGHDGCVRKLGEVEGSIVARRLGIDFPTFSNVFRLFQTLGWVSEDGSRITNWHKWQSVPQREYDSARNLKAYYERQLADNPEDIDAKEGVEKAAHRMAVLENFRNFPTLSGFSSNSTDSTKQKNTPISPLAGGSKSRFASKRRSTDEWRSLQTAKDLLADLKRKQQTEPTDERRGEIKEMAVRIANLKRKIAMGGTTT